MGDIQRAPWTDYCHPTVFSHLPWERNDGPCLSGQEGYHAAKLRRDAAAALALVNQIAGNSVPTEQLLNHVLSLQLDRVPVVVSPALAPGENTNSLALTYGKWLARDMEWEFSEKIFKARSAKRDFEKDPWYRIVAQPEFFGYVESDRHYIVADDLFHMGGTIACLRGFIESKGGCVIAASSLGHGGFGTQFALAQSQVMRLNEFIGLDDLLNEEMGYGIECLTAPESEILLRCATLDEIRTGIRRGRDACAL